MPRLRPRLLAGVLILPLLIGGFVMQERASRDGARLFDQVLSLVSNRFVDTLDAGALYEKAARGLVQQLDDPYSELFTPKELQRFSTTSTGHYGGVGMQIENQEGEIVVVRVFPNTPAEAAGVIEGDRIVKVDTAATRGWSTQQVSDALLGTPGTQVNVTFARPGVTEPIPHRITRAIINIPAVPYAIMLDGKVGYVPLQTFNETAADELQAATSQLMQQGAKGVIVDLRDDPGGILEQALSIADFFLRDGQPIVSVRGRQGLDQTYVARSHRHIADLPLVLLVNGRTASASEIVAGALQDHDRALVVGTTSFGKGLVQTVFQLDGGYALKMTTAKWYTPSGRLIHRPRNPQTLAAIDETPDSLESDSVKAARPVFHSDAGRVVYGGGGITPDLVVAPDTASTAEQEFGRAIAPKLGVVRATLYSYSLELKPQVQPFFTVKPEWRAEYVRRLRAAGVEITDDQVQAVGGLLDRMLANQVTRLAFGDSTETRRSLRAGEDKQLERAVDALRKGETQKDLFASMMHGKPQQH
ncbi:MAG TPA: S41 family peptidase [Gemmatimonadaceae bacterium]|nr:S41 family peptidase [Gemmatimonadaceae bacterium]